MGPVLTMEPAILHQLPIHHDYQHISPDSEYNDQYVSNAHQNQAYTSTMDQLRQDGPAPLQAPTPFTFSATNSTAGARFVPDRGVASDPNSFQTNTFSDSTGGSISASPSSAASSLTYTNYCANTPGYTGAVQLPQTFVHAPYGSGRVPSIASTGMLPPPNPIRSPLSGSTHATDRELYATSNATSFVARSQLSPAGEVGYGSFMDTTRSPLSIGGLSLSNPSYSSVHSHMASSGYSPNECSTFPWPNLEVQAEVICAGQPVTPEVHAKVEKGFFRSNVDQKWTCYRRNYFSVQCNFELHHTITNGRMELKRAGSTTTEQIQALGMRLSAAVDGSAGKGIELVQHTPKRDAGPKNKIEVVKVSPTPTSGRADHNVSTHGLYHVPMGTFHATGQTSGPLLPLQNANEGGSASSSNTSSSHMPGAYSYPSTPAHIPLPGQQTSHTFERVQFKQATANNGKRRASQQYFHLIVELYADVRKDGKENPVWTKVAHRVSEKIVVRGRSPSHYQNETQNGQSGRTGSTGGSSGYGSSAGATYGSLSAAGFRGSSGTYGGGISSGSYRTNTYGFHSSPEQSGSSASSVDGGAADSDYPGDSVLSDTDRHDIHGPDGYRYYPGPIFEGTPQVQGGLPLPKMESGARYSTDPSSWAAKHDYGDSVSSSQWGMPSINRFHSAESSRGYFPDLQVNYS